MNIREHARKLIIVPIALFASCDPDGPPPKPRINPPPGYRIERNSAGFYRAIDPKGKVVGLSESASYNSCVQWAKVDYKMEIEKEGRERNDWEPLK